jgi:SAM-dependent methyltransferase
MVIEVNQKLRENYSDYYSGESEWRRVAAISKVENILRLCHYYRHDSVLDIGAGEGAVLQRLAELNFGEGYWATEISATGVDAIKSRKIPNLRVCELYDGYTLPYSDKQFDLAILSHVVEHLEYPRKLIYEAGRVARKVFLEVPLEYTMLRPRDFSFSKVGHINFFTEKTLRWLVQSCGMKILAQESVVAGLGNHTYQQPKLGAVKYYLKESLLRVVPRIAPHILTYMGILVFTNESPEP